MVKKDSMEKSGFGELYVVPPALDDRQQAPMDW